VVETGSEMLEVDSRESPTIAVSSLSPLLSRTSGCLTWAATMREGIGLVHNGIPTVPLVCRPPRSFLPAPKGIRPLTLNSFEL